jgi:hypothetical protein
MSWPCTVSSASARAVRQSGVGDGAAEVRAASDPVDCVISAAPAAFLLVGYGRLPIRRALLRGGVLAWGRRPWLGLRFNDHFVMP